MSSKIVLFAAIAALAVSAVAVDSAVAARGGNGRGKPAPSPTVTLTVSSNPVPLGTYFTVTGTGFKPYASVSMEWCHPIGCMTAWSPADASGAVTQWNLASVSGTWKVDAYALTSKGYVLVGSVTFQVT